MKKQLKASGNGWELYFSKSFLKLLGYNPSTTKVLMTFKNKTLFIEPVCNESIDKLKYNMVRGFQRSGSSHSLYFPNTLIEVLEIKPDADYIDIEVDDKTLKIKKAAR